MCVGGGRSQSDTRRSIPSCHFNRRVKGGGGDHVPERAEREVVAGCFVF